jgi:hypothetical protein
MEILSKKEWMQICSNQEEVHILGSTRLKKASDGKNPDQSLIIDGVAYRKAKKTVFTKTAGYIDLGDGNYVRVLKKNPWAVILPLAIVLILVFLLLSGLSTDGTLPKLPLDLEDTRDISDEPAQYGYDYVDVPGFKEQLTISDEVPGIALKNPDSNSWYLYYAVFADGKAVCSTKLIAPGQQYDFNAKGVLSTGWHTLTIAVYTATEQGQTTGNPLSTQTVQVQVI